MEPMPSLGRIYQLAIQEESQQRAADYGKGGEGVALVAKVFSRPLQRTTGRREHRGLHLGFLEEDPRRYKKMMDSHDLVERSDGSRLIFGAAGSDGPRSTGTLESNGPRGLNLHGLDGSRRHFFTGFDGPCFPAHEQTFFSCEKQQSERKG